MIVKDSGGDFKPAPQGLHSAVCVDVVDLGVVKSKFGDRQKCRIVWQIEEVDDETNKRFLVSNMYTPSLHEKALLRSHLEAWRSRPFTPEELKGFDLEKLIGVNCQLQVIHNTRNGNTYANVAAVVPPAKGAQKLIPQDYKRARDRRADEPGDAYEATDEDVPF